MRKWRFLFRRAKNFLLCREDVHEKERYRPQLGAGFFGMSSSNVLGKGRGKGSQRVMHAGTRDEMERLPDSRPNTTSTNGSGSTRPLYAPASSALYPQTADLYSGSRRHIPEPSLELQSSNPVCCALFVLELMPVLALVLLCWCLCLCLCLCLCRVLVLVSSAALLGSE